MAKLGGLINQAQIARLGPDFDFYYWKTIPVVRIYPQHIRQPGTEAQCKTWEAMLAAIDGWGITPTYEKTLWSAFVGDSHRSGKDLYYRLVLSREASFPKSWCNWRLMEWRYEPGLLYLYYETDRECIGRLFYTPSFSTTPPTPWKWIFDHRYLRGRRWLRRFKLRENYQESIDEDAPAPQLTHEFWVRFEEEIRSITFYIANLATPTAGRSPPYSLTLEP